MTYNEKKDREFVDNLRHDYAAFDSQTLLFALDTLQFQIDEFGEKMDAKVLAIKELRLEIIREELTRRGISF